MWPAICASALSLATFRTLNQEANYFYVAFCLTVAMAAYALDRLPGLSSPEDRLNRPRCTSWHEIHIRKSSITIRLALFASFVLLVSLEKMVMSWIAAYGVLAIAYMLPVVPWSRNGKFRRRPLRELGSLKPFLLAFVWTGGTVHIPALLGKGGQNMGIGNDVQFWALMLDRFILLFANALAFDAMDYEGDRSCNRRTFAVRFGIRGVLKLEILWLIGWSLIIAMHGISIGSSHIADRIVPFLLLIFVLLRFRKTLENDQGISIADSALPIFMEGVLLIPLALTYF